MSNKTNRNSNQSKEVKRINNELSDEKRINNENLPVAQRINNEQLPVAERINNGFNDVKRINNKKIIEYDCDYKDLFKEIEEEKEQDYSFKKVKNIITYHSLKTLCNIDKFKVVIYIFYFIIYFILYYSIIIPRTFPPFQPKNMKPYKTVIIISDIIYVLFLIGALVYYFKNFFTITQKMKLYVLFIPIIVGSILIAFNTYIYNEYLQKMSQSKATSIIFYIISIAFYIIFLSLFIFNINDSLNIEFLLSLVILILFLIEYIISTRQSLKDIYYNLKNNNFSLITTTCFTNNDSENFENSNVSTNNEIIAINQKYGPNYLKTDGNIPIAFLNNITNNYQNLVLCDFYYPASNYTYIPDTPLNGTPSIDAINISITNYGMRFLTFDIYSNSSNEYDSNASPIIKCENMSINAEPLNLDDVFGTINKYAWVTHGPDHKPYPLFIYLRLKYNIDNTTITDKINDSYLKFFGKYLPDPKYGYNGRNSTFPISKAPMEKSIGKVFLITDNYPTKTVFDESITACTNNLSDNFNLNIYKTDYIKWPDTGLSNDYDKTKLINDCKTKFNIFYSQPNEKYANDNNEKAGLFNPSFQDCAQYGCQGTLMFPFLPDINFNFWYNYFIQYGKIQPILKDESLRSVLEEKVVIQQQNPVVGLQTPTETCVGPKDILPPSSFSNLSDKSTNNSCSQ